jgi:hypothetical protein
MFAVQEDKTHMVHEKCLQNFNRKPISETWGRRLKGNKMDLHGTGRSWDSSLNILTIVRAGRSGNRVSISGRGREIFLSSTPYRLVLGFIQPAIHWIPRTISPEVKWPGHEADHSPHPLPRMRMSGYMPPLPHTPSPF